MAFRASLLVTADAAQAKGELRETAAEVAKTTEATRGSGIASVAAASEIRRLVAERKAEAAAAERQQAAIRQVVDAYAGIRAASSGAQSSASVFSAEIDRQARGFGELRASLDPVYRASKQYEAAVETVRSAVEIGAVSQREANVVLAAAERQYLSVAQVVDQAALAQQQAAQDFQQVRLALDPLYRASTQYEAVLQTVNAAVASGATTQAQASAVLAAAERQYLALAQVVDQAAAAQLKAAGEFDAMRMALDPLYRSSKQYEAAVETAAAAVRTGAATQEEANRVMALAEGQYLAVGTAARGAGVAAGAGAFQVANLAAQFNDIGVMLAAGQSPLQLALQQGTQISQVLGPMGAGGAVRALGAGFLAMLNPISLVTIGSIAAGAALFSWLREAGPAAIDLGEAIDELDASIDAVAASTRRMSSGALDEMVEKYGAITGELRAMLRAQDDLARRTAFLDLLTAQQGIAAALAEQFRAIDSIDTLKGRNLKSASDTTERVFGMSRAEIDEVAAAMERAKTAATPEGMAEAWRQVYERVVEIYGGFQQLSSGQVTLKAEQVQFLEYLVASEDSARRLAGIDMASGVAKARAEATRFADEMARARDAAFDLGKSGAERLEDARIRAAYANDPVEQARQLAIREMERTQAPIYAGLGARDSAAREGLAAQAQEYGDYAAQTAAADEARRKLLSTSRSGAKDFDQERKAVEDLLAQERQRLAVLREADPVQQQLLSVSDRMTAATVEERKELEGLIAARLRATDAARVQDMVEGLQAELEILRELDPVQQEMIRNRERLKGATDEEREAVEQLIRAREGEREAARTADLFGRTAYDAFDSLIFKGGRAIDVVDSLTAALAKATFEAALLGEGGLAGPLGTAGSGGLLGGLATGLASALMPTAGFTAGQALPGGGSVIAPSVGLGRLYARGGPIVGPGTGTSDSIVARVSNGEFIVNATATARHRALLEAINDNRPLPAFARGGYVNVPPPPSFAPASGGGAGGGAQEPAPIIQIINNTSVPMEATAKQRTDASGRKTTRLQLSDMTGAGITQPGGGGRRAMQQAYGLRPTGPRR